MIIGYPRYLQFMLIGYPRFVFGHAWMCIQVSMWSVLMVFRFVVLQCYPVSCWKNSNLSAGSFAICDCHFQANPMFVIDWILHFSMLQTADIYDEGNLPLQKKFHRVHRFYFGIGLLQRWEWLFQIAPKQCLVHSGPSETMNAIVGGSTTTSPILPRLVLPGKCPLI